VNAELVRHLVPEQAGAHVGFGGRHPHFHPHAVFRRPTLPTATGS
jgi:hypothetical protein